jgi:D-alanyl-D-alanine dipeptidase
MVFRQKNIYNLLHKHHATHFFYFHDKKTSKQSTLHIHQHYQPWNKYGSWLACDNDAFRAKKL